MRYSAASTLLGLTASLAGLLLLRWVAPQQMGLWQSLLLVQTYSTLVQAGVFNGLNRELPYRLGNGDPEAMELVSTGQGFSIIVVALLLVGAVGSLFVSTDPSVRYVLPAVFIASASAIYQQFLGATYRADRAFRKLAIISVIDAGVTIATLPIVYLLGYPGLPLRYLVLGFIAAGSRHIWRPFAVPTRLNLRHLVVLLKVGVPLYGLGYLLNVSNTLPRVVLLSRGSLEMVGLFSPAAAMITLMVMVPQSVAQYIYPRMSYRLGETGDPNSLWPMAWKGSLGMLAFSVPLVLVGLIAVPPLIDIFIPEYAVATNAVRWTLVGGMFLGASIAVNALNSLKAWGLMSVYTGSRLATNFLFPFIGFSFFSSRIEGVASGYALAQMVCFFIALVCVYAATRVEGVQC